MCCTSFLRERSKLACGVLFSPLTVYSPNLRVFEVLTRMVFIGLKAVLLLRVCVYETYQTIMPSCYSAKIWSECLSVQLARVCVYKACF